MQINENIINETVENIRSRNINVIVVENKAEALEKIKELIPEGSQIMTGSSTTLQQIGFTDYLKQAEHNWEDYHKTITSENDDEKRHELRRKSVASEYFLTSVNAISKDGELVAVDASGSRVGAIPFAAEKLIIVAGINKIADSLDGAIKRIKEVAYPLEDERAKKAYGSGTTFGKWVILERELDDSRTTLILVKEELGF